MPLLFDQPVPVATIHPYSQNSLGGLVAGSSIPTSANWTTANRAYFIPFRLYKPALVYKLGCVNGSVLSGNLDIGIYDYTGTKLISTGSVAQAGRDRVQEITVTTTELGAGLFYLAMAMDNNVGTVFRRALSLTNCRELGMYLQASAFVLPASSVFATLTTGFVPLVFARTYPNA